MLTPSIPTIVLIQLLAYHSNTWIEARLMLKGAYSTHFLFYSGENILLDEGCDSETSKTTLDDFLNHYRNGSWRLTQIA